MWAVRSAIFVVFLHWHGTRQLGLGSQAIWHVDRFHHFHGHAENDNVASTVFVVVGVGCASESETKACACGADEPSIEEAEGREGASIKRTETWSLEQDHRRFLSVCERVCTERQSTRRSSWGSLGKSFSNSYLYQWHHFYNTRILFFCLFIFFSCLFACITHTFHPPTNNFSRSTHVVSCLVCDNNLFFLFVLLFSL